MLKIIIIIFFTLNTFCYFSLSISSTIREKFCKNMIEAYCNRSTNLDSYKRLLQLQTIMYLLLLIASIKL